MLLLLLAVTVLLIPSLKTTPDNSHLETITSMCAQHASVTQNIHASLQTSEQSKLRFTSLDLDSILRVRCTELMGFQSQLQFKRFPQDKCLHDLQLFLPGVYFLSVSLRDIRTLYSYVILGIYLFLSTQLKIH